MKGNGWINPVLFVALLGMVALCWFVPGRDVSRPNYEFLPEAQMAQSPAYDSFAPNPNFADGLTLRTPPDGTIARGHMPLHYEATLQDALRAGQELVNPFPQTDTARRERGTAVFTNYCQVCHGPLGQGNGPVALGGFPPPASLLAERALQMKDGQMFHVLTYGQGNMPPFSAQLSRDDRWSVILHVRMLQRPYAPGRSLPEIAKLFRQNCAACHGEDGTGSNVRKAVPLIPDFTSLAWQMSQTEMAIVNQIDYGTAPLMPAWRYKLTREQVLGLAVYIRSFAAHQPGAQPAVAPSSHLSARSLFGTFCFSCHDSNGTGIASMRAAMPELPDFTKPTWQKSRTDADLAHSIVEGKGKFMLPMKDKLGTIDVKEMVALVRGFDGGKQIIEPEPPKGFGPPPPTILPKPEDLLPLSPGKEPKAPSPLVAPSGEDAARIRIGANIFRQYCFVCHGIDGTGSPTRASMPAIPDFTSEAFHKEHSDAQIRTSILEGKGTLMPANRGRVTEEEARDLVAYVRAFGPPSFRFRPPEPSDSEFEKAYRKLEQQMDEYHKELEKLKRQP
jgi:cbb3-type cytochrome c oxidase subunit III